MLKAEERMELDVLRKHGASIRELAKATGRSRNTVRRYVRGGEAAATRKPATEAARKATAYFRENSPSSVPLSVAAVKPPRPPKT